MEEFGHIDILVNSAGMNIRKPILEIGDEDWDPYNICVNAISPSADFITGHNLFIDGGRTVN